MKQTKSRNKKIQTKNKQEKKRKKKRKINDSPLAKTANKPPDKKRKRNHRNYMRNFKNIIDMYSLDSITILQINT